MASVNILEARSAPRVNQTARSPYFRYFLLVFGATLCLGGLAHSAGVLNFYRTNGLPDANRVLLDFWVAEAQLAGGFCFLCASRALRDDKPWRLIAIIGAVNILSYALPFIPVLIARAPAVFQAPAEAYSLLSLMILFQAARRETKRDTTGGVEPPRPGL